MVCSVGNGRMAVMARILQGRSVSQNVAGSEREKYAVSDSFSTLVQAFV